MFPNPLVASVLWLTVAALPAQHFLGVGSEARRLTRATWLGFAGEQTVALDYGQPKWNPEYEASVNSDEGLPLLLGNGALTTLRNDVELTFGAHKIPRGRWYVSAKRDGQQWSLVLFAAERVDADRRGTIAMFATEPEHRVPVTVTRKTEQVERFTAELAAIPRKHHHLELTMAFGPYRLQVEFAAAFDDRKPEGAPEFALTAEGRGKKTDSGLIVETLREGAGAAPGPDDAVRVHYTYWLTDGTMIESTYMGGTPALLGPEMVVKGFAEAWRLMAPGGTYRLTIPPELAFGAHGMGRVPPNSTLVYTVTLLGSKRR